jgi:hypothetical protein
MPQVSGELLDVKPSAKEQFQQSSGFASGIARKNR